MLKFAANLTMLFNEVAFLDRFELASRSGFKYVEYLFPYEWSADELAKKLNQFDLQQVLFNLPAGDWANGERGIACLPDRKEEFKEGLALAIEYAEVLQVSQVNCLSGLRPNEETDEVLWETLIENISYAASRLQDHNICLMIEPINSKVDMPGFFIDTFEKAKLLLNAVNSTNIKIQFDIYHMQIMQGDILHTIASNLKDIGHIQFADCPGRHEPGSGELNFDNIFHALDKMKFDGFVSAEYIPQHDSISSLHWLPTLVTNI